jgi:hypothetical protein
MGVLRFDSYDFHPTAVLDSHPDGILVVDHSGVVRYANPAAAHAFDTSLECVVGRAFGVPLDEKRPVEVKSPQGRLVRLRCVPTLWASQPARLVCLTEVGEPKATPSTQVRVVGRDNGADDDPVANFADQIDALHDALDALQRSAGNLGDRLRASPVLLVQHAADTLADHAAALDALAPSGQVARLPELLDDLARELGRENATAVEAAEQLHKTLGRLRSGLNGLRRKAVRSDERPTPTPAPSRKSPHASRGD